MNFIKIELMQPSFLPSKGKLLKPFKKKCHLITAAFAQRNSSFRSNTVNLEEEKANNLWYFDNLSLSF